MGPNHALQRTAPGVTACAPSRRPAPATFPHRLRRPPQSLSLGSLGDTPRLVSNVAAFPFVPSMTRHLTRFYVPSPAGQAGFAGSSAASSGFDGAAVSHAFGGQTSTLATPIVTPNHALQRTAPVGHACCSPQSPPRSSRARPPRSLSLRSLGASSEHTSRHSFKQSVTTI